MRPHTFQTALSVAIGMGLLLAIAFVLLAPQPDSNTKYPLAADAKVE